MKKIAIIGAGLAGLTVANQLKDYADITIFEKSRGVGGRIATRYSEDFEFDHGAQFFKVKTEEFQSFINPMLEEGVIKEWYARFIEFDKHNVLSKRQWDKNKPNYVGAPKMNSIAKFLSINTNILLNRLVTPVKQNNLWQIIDSMKENLGSFDWVIITAPAAQTLNLIPKSLPCYDYIAYIKMEACFSLMLGFDEPLPLDFDAALVKNADISWISVNSSKPDRLNKCSLLIHSTNQWANNNLDQPKEIVLQHLIDEASKIIGQNLNIACHKALHCWKYANIKKQKGDKSIIDMEQKIGICGDWFIQGRIESAFLSAMDLSQKIKTAII